MRRWALGSVITTAVIVVGACSSAATPSPSASAAPSAASAAPSAAASASSAPSASASSAPSPAAIAVPANITSAGKLVFCSDISYPPEESYAADGTTPQGSDIDIANEIAKRFGVKAEIDNTGFDGIIPALNAKKCDLIISGMNDTPTRAQQVNFVDYLKVGQGLVVPAGNPKNLQTLADLSGHSVAVELGTTNKDALDAENKLLIAAGKPKIDIQTFQADTDAFNQLKLGRVDAYSGDSPVCAYYAAQSNGKFVVGGSPIAPALIGIAIRKTDTQLTTAVQAAIDAMYADGTMKSIVDKWGMTNAVVLLK